MDLSKRMKRKSVRELDKKDKQLLYLLDINGRATYSSLAKQTKMSKQLVSYRVARLENEGYIKGYIAMVDMFRLGYVGFRVYLKLRNATAEVKEKLLHYLHQQPAIWATITMAGKWDIALGISVKQVYEFYDTWDALLENHLVHIADYFISIYSPVYHYAKSYIVDKKDMSPVRVLGGKGKADVDDVDFKVLNVLAHHARAPLLEVAEKVGMTAEAVKYRIKQLEKKGVIQGYRAMIDVAKLGYNFFKAEVRLARYDVLKGIMQYCHQHPNIYQVNRTIGGETIEIEFNVKTVEEMYTILADMEKQFPGAVEKFDYLTILSEEKIMYMPEL
jgi:Lrp/AsnC family transcriptional regulator, leucine-responsive regulatory protein